VYKNRNVVTVVEEGGRTADTRGDITTHNASQATSVLQRAIMEKTNTVLTAVSSPIPGEQKSGITTVEAREGENNERKNNPFLNPKAAEHWRQVYEKNSYECRHVFDPHFTWSEEEEKRLVRKLDWRICLWAVWINPKESRICSPG
jgi:hypothetical protein